MTRAISQVGILGVLTVLVALSGCKRYAASEEEAPTQPIAFYHSVHAGENQIPCMYCHYTADQSSSAGIPSVKLCVGCHVPGSGSQAPEQAVLGFPSAERDSLYNAEATKLVDYWRRQESIPWVKVHNLPAHAKFPHSSHVRVGVQCQTCHGPVEEMEEIYQYSSLQMGWCISCHTGEMELSAAEEQSIRERSTWVRKVAALAAAGEDVGGLAETWPNMRASIDCMVCHY